MSSLLINNDLINEGLKLIIRVHLHNEAQEGIFAWFQVYLTKRYGKIFFSCFFFLQKGWSACYNTNKEANFFYDTLTRNNAAKVKVSVPT